MTTNAIAASPRDVIEGYFADIAAGRFAEAAARSAPDATLWIAGEGHWPMGGTHDPASVREIYATVADRFPQGIKITLHALTVEGDRVAAETETYGVRRDGRIYNNRYHYVIIVRDGLIRSRREYLDTVHANDLLCGPLESDAA